MKKTRKHNTCPIRKANRRHLDDPEARKRKRQEKAVIAACIKKVTRHFSPDEDWL